MITDIDMLKVLMIIVECAHDACFCHFASMNMSSQSNRAKISNTDDNSVRVAHQALCWLRSQGVKLLCGISLV